MTTMHHRPDDETSLSLTSAKLCCCPASRELSAVNQWGL